MAITRDAFIQNVRRLKEFYSSRSAAYAGMAEAMLSGLESGRPLWFERFAGVWGDRPPLTYYEAPALVLHRLHFWALRGNAPALRPLLASCGGEWRREGAAAVLSFLDLAPEAFWREVGDSRLQTNEVARSLGWLLVGSAAFGPRNTPYHLVEMGTGAGLCLIGDYIPRAWNLSLRDGKPASPFERWEAMPYPVLSRTGLDLAPVDVGDPQMRQWLRACLGPDSPEAGERFDRAAELFLILRDEPSGPKLLKSHFLEMPSLISKRVRPHQDEGLLLFNAQATDFLSDGDYRRLRSAVREVLEPWEDRGFWAELERPRDHSSDRHRLVIHRLMDGILESRVLSELGPGPMEATLFPGWDILRPLKPVLSPRITREEPPKSLKPGLYSFPENQP